MKSWREPKFYKDTVPHRAAAFFLGLSVSIQRPIIVIEENARGFLIDPARIYGARDDAGKLRQVAGTAVHPAIIPAYTDITFDDIQTLIRKRDGSMGRTPTRPQTLLSCPVSQIARTLLRLRAHIPTSVRPNGCPDAD